MLFYSSIGRRAALPQRRADAAHGNSPRVLSLRRWGALQEASKAENLRVLATIYDDVRQMLFECVYVHASSLSLALTAELRRKPRRELVEFFSLQQCGGL